MKKNYLKFLSVLMICCISCGFLSCSDDDDNNDGTSNSKLIGKWQLTNVKILTNDVPNTYQPCDYEDWIAYNADGSITSYDACDGTTGKGTWEVKDNILTEKSSSFLPVESEIKELTDDKLVTVLDFMYKQEFTYKRIK